MYGRRTLIPEFIWRCAFLMAWNVVLFRWSRSSYGPKAPKGTIIRSTKILQKPIFPQQIRSDPPSVSHPALGRAEDTPTHCYVEEFQVEALRSHISGPPFWHKIRHPCPRKERRIDILRPPTITRDVPSPWIALQPSSFSKSRW